MIFALRSDIARSDNSCSNRAGATQITRPAHAHSTGFWQQMVPDRFIHETLDVNVIKRLLDERAATIQRNLLRFGPQYRDKLYYFVVLDDMVR